MDLYYCLDCGLVLKVLKSEIKITTQIMNSEKENIGILIVHMLRIGVQSKRTDDKNFSCD